MLWFPTLYVTGTVTTWHNIVVSRHNENRANYIMNFLRKGSKVYVSGSADNSSYTSRDGNTSYFHFVRTGGWSAFIACHTPLGPAMLLPGPAMLLPGPAMLLPGPAMLLPSPGHAVEGDLHRKLESIPHEYVSKWITWSSAVRLVGDGQRLYMKASSRI